MRHQRENFRQVNLPEYTVVNQTVKRQRLFGTAFHVHV
jgi:hypothetical protein